LGIDEGGDKRLEGAMAPHGSGTGGEMLDRASWEDRCVLTIIEEDSWTGGDKECNTYIVAAPKKTRRASRREMLRKHERDTTRMVQEQGKGEEEEEDVK
jgi:hypothetical protein